jgi:hypothetical protein
MAWEKDVLFVFTPGKAGYSASIIYFFEILTVHVNPIIEIFLYASWNLELSCGWPAPAWATGRGDSYL